MSLQAGDIQDLLNTTLEEQGRGRITDLMTDIQHFHAMSKLMNREKVSYSSGTSIQYQVALSNSGAAKNTGLFATDSVNVGDVTATANVPWRHAVTNYAFDRREFAMNRDPARIFDLVRLRRGDAITSLAELMEANFWGGPGSTADTKTPFGMNYWFPAINDTALGNGDQGTGGFDGLDWLSFDTAGLDRSAAANARWKHWVDGYDTLDYDPASGSNFTVVQAMRKAMVFCKFMPPAGLPSYNSSPRYGVYTKYEVIESLERALRSQNDALGMDIAATDGKLTFRGIPVEWVPYWEEDGGGGEFYTDAGTGEVVTNPVLGIDWGTVKFTFLSGEDMRETVDTSISGQHNVQQVHMDSSYNICVKDPRRCFSLKQVATTA